MPVPEPVPEITAVVLHFWSGRSESIGCNHLSDKPVFTAMPSMKHHSAATSEYPGLSCRQLPATQRNSPFSEPRRLRQTLWHRRFSEETER
jgi:hypothetical protein